MNCKANFIFQDGSCLENFLSYQSIISEDKARSISNSFLILSSISLGLSILIGIIEGIMVGESELILITQLNTFKMPFLILSSASFPLPIYLIL